MTYIPTQRTLAQIEREYILATLTNCNGNRTYAAKYLGISIRSLRMKLHDYKQSGITVPPPSTEIGTDNGPAFFDNDSILPHHAEPGA